MIENRWFLFVRFWYGFRPAFPFEKFDHVVDDKELVDGVHATALKWANSNRPALKTFVVGLNKEEERETALRAMRRGGQPETGTTMSLPSELDVHSDPADSAGKLSVREARKQPDLLLDAAGWRRRRTGPIIVSGPDGKIVDPYASSAHHVMSLEGAEVAKAVQALLGQRVADCPPMRHPLRGSVVCRVGAVTGTTLDLHQRIDARAQEAALLLRRDETHKVGKTFQEKAAPEEAFVTSLISLAEKLIPLVQSELPTELASETAVVGFASNSPGNVLSSKLKEGDEGVATEGMPTREETPSVPLDLNVTDTAILALLEKPESGRLRTREIALMANFHEKSIGKNLSKLKKAGLIDNPGRGGYARTSTPRPKSHG